MQERFDALVAKYGLSEFIKRLGDALYERGLVGWACNDSELNEIFDELEKS